MLTRADVAERLAIGVEKVLGLIKRGELPGAFNAALETGLKGGYAGEFRLQPWKVSGAAALPFPCRQRHLSDGSRLAM
jgi:hypothetical protein